MSQTQPLPPKKDVALALLERSSVYVHLDPRQPAVIVPVAFKKKAQLVLQIGLNMPVPIPDLRLGDDGITCTLSFSRVRFCCSVPWASVFAMVGDDGRGMVWPEDVPVEVARQAQVRVIDGGANNGESAKAVVARAPEAEAPKAKRTRKRASLAAVADTGEPNATAAVKARPAAERSAQTSKSSPSAPEHLAGAEAPRFGTMGSRKKKRDLPPYLRVVK